MQIISNGQDLLSLLVCNRVFFPSWCAKGSSLPADVQKGLLSLPVLNMIFFLCWSSKNFEILAARLAWFGQLVSMNDPYYPHAFKKKKKKKKWSGCSEHFCLSVCLSHYLFQNHWTEFNQTCYMTSSRATDNFGGIWVFNPIKIWPNG